MKKYIAYYRVSTKQQGLGLEAQKAIVEAYVKNQNGIIVCEFSEKESGKETNHRVELQNAIRKHRELKATLIVAKLDRLSRNVADVFNMVKSKHNQIEICDMDAQDTMMLGIFSTLAMKERELISTRTKEALKALKAQGVKLGNPNASEAMKKIHHLGTQTLRNKANSDENNRRAFAAVRFMEATLVKKAQYLNENGFCTPRGSQWTATQVKRLIARYSDVA